MEGGGPESGYQQRQYISVVLRRAQELVYLDFTIGSVIF